MKKKKKKQIEKWRILGDFKFQDTYSAAIVVAEKQVSVPSLSRRSFFRR